MAPLLFVCLRTHLFGNRVPSTLSHSNIIWIIKHFENDSSAIWQWSEKKCYIFDSRLYISIKEKSINNLQLFLIFVSFGLLKMCIYIFLLLWYTFPFCKMCTCIHFTIPISSWTSICQKVFFWIYFSTRRHN